MSQFKSSIFKFLGSPFQNSYGFSSRLLGTDTPQHQSPAQTFGIIETILLPCTNYICAFLLFRFSLNIFSICMVYLTTFKGVPSLLVINKCMSCSSHALCYGHVRLCVSHNSLVSYDGDFICASHANKADCQ